MDIIGMGIKLTIIMITINAGLFALGITGESPVLAWIPTGLDPEQIDPNQLDSIGGVDTESGISTEEQSSFALPFITPALNFFGDIWQIIASLLFGFVEVMYAIGLPAVIIFIVGVPLALIEILTILWFILSLIGAVAGVR